MNKIRILGTKPFKHPFPIVSWIIRLIEWSKQSHVVIHDVEEDVVIHARFNEIIEEDFNDYMKRNVITEAHEIILNEIEYISMRSFASVFIGKQKGYWRSLLGVMIPQIIRSISRDKIKLDNFWPKGFTCSWFIHVVMVMTGGLPSEVFNKYKQTDDEAALTTDDILFAAKKIVDLQTETK